ncbi:SprT family zinc-dependent metalloprotease [Devosia sp. YIM 151766]|uniref:M48 family metallopeptidase n=1 Tax=Devosia sp. YIM 151766 TaxID=3017325 RepID=UPI00255C4E38|nr:SprT family zinc-dependent metalloprotease [Devosia sp. YIM 151766]WIY53242.1 SprT family zinc-dependent metalloprotease [Devosia sp. YIM 151766]
MIPDAPPMFSFLRQRTAPPPITHVELDGVMTAIAVRTSKRARNFRLSLPASGPLLTLPEQARWADAEAFLYRHRHWLAARLPRTAPAQMLQAGVTIPLRGVPHRIIAAGTLRGRVEMAEDGEGPLLRVPGDPEHQPRRLYDWLKAEALADLVARSQVHAGRLGVEVKQVRLRSQSSRWGSCSSSGNINYNWRLILAPPFVLDYVAAHEVAHLVEMNHSPAFWRTVVRTLPEMERGRAWLKAHGRGLMAWRAPGEAP